MKTLFYFLSASSAFFLCASIASAIAVRWSRWARLVRQRDAYVRALEETTAKAVKKANSCMDKSEYLLSENQVLSRKLDALELMYYWKNGRKLPPERVPDEMKH